MYYTQPLCPLEKGQRPLWRGWLRPKPTPEPVSLEQERTRLEGSMGDRAVPDLLGSEAQ